MAIAPTNNYKSKMPWPEGAIEDWQHGASYGWIATRYGRGYSTVAKLIRNAMMLGTQRVVDIAARKRQGGRLPLHQQRPIGQMHIHIGLQVGRFREIENGYSISEWADLIGSNRVTARMMELGLHDFSLSEIERISGVMGVPIIELFGPYAAANDEVRAAKSL